MRVKLAKILRIHSRVQVIGILGQLDLFSLLLTGVGCGGDGGKQMITKEFYF